ncbi:MAG: 4-phosphopantetheinyl transferase [Burkholderiales bacterium]
MLKVQPWPGLHSLSAAALRADANPVVLAVATPDTAIRDVARGLVRQALREVLGVLLECPPEAVPLVSQPGQPLRLNTGGRQIGLSVSHERGLTLAAIHVGGAVGIDLMRIEQRADWLPDWEPVALAYLGGEARNRIARHSPVERPQSFAREWTGHEACLKCGGLPLQEWSPALQQKLLRCRLFELDLPERFIGTLASAPEDEVTR